MKKIPIFFQQYQYVPRPFRCTSGMHFNPFSTFSARRIAWNLLENQTLKAVVLEMFDDRWHRMFPRFRSDGVIATNVKECTETGGAVCETTNILIICEWKKSFHFRHDCYSWWVPILVFLLQNCLPNDVLGNYKRCRKNKYIWYPATVGR